MVDTVCLLTLPGAGDDIQAIKAGIIEIADILVVNKGDLPGADVAVKDLLQMQKLGHPRTDWRPPVVKTSASNGDGIDELMAAVAKHRDWAIRCGEAERRAADAMRAEIQELMRDRVLRDLAGRIDSPGLENVVARVVAREIDPYGAADLLLDAIGWHEGPPT